MLLPGPRTRFVAAPDAPAETVREMQRRARRFDWEASATGAPEPAVREDVFCSASGHVWDAAGNVLVGKGWPLHKASLRAMADAPVVDDLAFARGGEAHRNFFHWMAESLPSVAPVLDFTGPRQIPIGIMPEPSRFVPESLMLAARDGFSLLRLGHATRVRRLHIFPMRTWTLVHRAIHAAMFERMIARAEAAVPELPDSERIYIARTDSTRRQAANEQALADALARRGYRIVTLGAMPLVAQIATMRRARFIVAQHGAGLSHLIFAPPGCRVVEIFPASIGIAASRMAMMRLSRIFGHRHVTWVEAGPPPQDGENAPNPAWSISVEPLLRQVVDTM
jgi:capsular polysaccharide biosynthesis protein